MASTKPIPLAFSNSFNGTACSQVVLVVKNPPAVQKMQILYLGQEDPLEEEVTIHSSMLAWTVPWTEEPGGYSPWGCKGLDKLSD